MEPSSKREFIISMVVVILVAGFFGYRYWKQETTPQDPFRPWDTNALPSVQGGTREKLSGISVETLNTTSSVGVVTGFPENVAVPIAIESYGTAAKRTFVVVGEYNTFTPSFIVVNEGDSVEIRLKAVDNNYNFFIPDFGAYKTVTKGEIGIVRFDTAAFGKYEFFCRDACEGRDKVSGTLIVNKR